MSVSLSVCLFDCSSELIKFLPEFGGMSVVRYLMFLSIGQSLSICPSTSSSIFIYLFILVNLSVLLSTIYSICLSFFQSVCPSVYLSLRQSVCLSVCLSICLIIYLSVCLIVCPSVWLSVCLFGCLSGCLFSCLSVCLSVCLVVRVSVCQPIHLTFSSYLPLPIYLYLLLSLSLSLSPSFTSGNKAVKPRSLVNTSIPGILSTLQVSRT